MSKRAGRTGNGARVDPAVHANRGIVRDPSEELEQSARLKAEESPDELLERYSRHAFVDSAKDAVLRRVILRALCKSFGHGVQVGIGVLVKHPETIEIGDGVFLGNQAFLQ